MKRIETLCALLRGAVGVLALAILSHAHAAEVGAGKGQSKVIDPELALTQFKVPEGFKVDLFAAEPQLRNPVAFHIDERGRVFVSETYRHQTAVLDIRKYMHLFEEDLACRTVDDRLSMIQRHFGGKMEDFTKESEVIRLIEDRDGDGRADTSTVFAEGFNTPLDGIASGVLARKGKVYFANIPNLWELADTDGDGRADNRRSLSHGYGVHFNYTGHDLHGLILGPDCKLYFTMGDRGLHVKTAEGRVLDHPDTGVVLRCNPDGSALEVFATGVRNPQELAFDDFGNLFTGDNNCDHGDSARLVHVVEGGDSGWRLGYQFNEHNPAGPWNAEKIWHLRHEGQPAHILPPIAHIGNGPSGFAHYPGTGFGDKYKGHFFLCDFKGQAARSGVHTFTLRPKGASFEVAGLTNFLWDILVTDVDFGPDGRMYVTDWVHGWPQSQMGRIYRLFDPDQINSPLVKETQRLIGEGMDGRSAAELKRLLAHPDRRVRQEAQFALGAQGRAALATLRQAIHKRESQMTRIHGIWGIGLAARQNAKDAEVLLPLLRDADPEIRAQAAKVLGEARAAKSAPELTRLLKDSSPRVQFFAAMSLGKLGDKKATGPILEMLRANGDRDVYLRHAGVMGLAGIGDVVSLTAAAKDSSASVRMGALLALRRLARPEVALFLNDEDPLLVEEAARAISDAPIPAALPNLAAIIERPAGSQALVRRVINANYRLGQPENARALGALAARADVPEAYRAEALQLLATWPKPLQRDRIIGDWRPLAERDGAPAVAALRPILGGLLQAGPDKVRAAAAQAVATFGLGEFATLLHELARSESVTDNVRVESLKALADLRDARLDEALQAALGSTAETVRKEAIRLQSRLASGNQVATLTGILETGSLPEKQTALVALGKVEGEEVDAILAGWLDRLNAGTVEHALALELLQAGARRSNDGVQKKLEAFNARRSKESVRSEHPELLAGGNAQAGREIFFERTEASCIRCHRVNGEGGEAGPDLTGIGATQSREYLLEAVLYPNRAIASGFETVVVLLKDGNMHAGVIKGETADRLEIFSPEDGDLVVNKADIQTREAGMSGMPEGMDLVLSKRDLRDLVEYLASLNGAGAGRAATAETGR